MRICFQFIKYFRGFEILILSYFKENSGMLEERLPTIEETRQRIEDMNTSKKNGKLYQNAFRYIFLIAGNVSEITSKYPPLGRDAIKTKMKNIDAVIFPVKTARRKGRIRPIALPCNPLYERWTDTLYSWFSVHDDAQPFGGLNMRSFQREAIEVFKGLAWPVEEYTKTVYVEPEKSRIILERTRQDDVREYLVEYPNLERRWVENPRIQLKTELTDKHWRPFSLLSLRQQRIRDLKYYYEFTDDQIRTFTGLSSMDPNNRKSSSLDRYNWVNPSEEHQLSALKFAAESYFEKLLKYRE